MTDVVNIQDKIMNELNAKMEELRTKMPAEAQDRHQKLAQEVQTDIYDQTLAVVSSSCDDRFERLEGRMNRDLPMPSGSVGTCGQSQIPTGQCSRRIDDVPEGETGRPGARSAFD